MPFIRATISNPDLSEQTQRTLATGLTKLAATVLNRQPERTSVCLSLVPADRYYVAGEPVGAAIGAHVEISLTVGRSSAAEKAEFIRRVYEFLHETLGLLPPVAGVAITEFHPENYGYNGITQLESFRQR